MMLTEALLRWMWPRGDSRVPGLIAGIAAAAPTEFARYGLITPRAVALAMGQFTEECGAGTEMVENLNYRASALLTQWPRHFTPAQAVAMQHDPRRIADQAYNGRMGNRAGTEDGWNYRGRGPSQLTGREFYQRAGALRGLDLLASPDLVNAPQHALGIALADFAEICHCVPAAARGDIDAVSRLLNGGDIGLAERRAATHAWLHVLGVG